MAQEQSAHEQTGHGGRTFAQAGIPSRAAIAGHPIHPMLIPLPLGLLTMVPFSDVVFLVSRDPFWAQASWWLLLVGGVTAVVAAGVGLMDFVGIRAVREHRHGWFHMLGNVLAVAVTLANLLVRDGPRAETAGAVGVILSFATLGILVFSGWSGGELVYRHRIGVLDHASAQRHGGG
ncbi:MAG: DUF2231 domain-containing protein [Candidatus Krumholzibacteriia bacterium]